MIKSIDHIALATYHPEECVDFYARVLGMELERFGEGALRFGDQKIDLHPPGLKTEAFACHPTAGSLDLCFLADQPLDQVIAELEAKRVPIELGPVRRTGARFQLRSVYVRDPDQNLIEISEPAL